MIDIENEVFTRAATPVWKKYPNAFVSGEYVKTPPSFPAVSIVEMDNLPYEKTQTTESVENHATVTYEVNVYSNLTRGKKAECKAIIALIDEVFAALGFTRTTLNPVPDMNDATIYRMVARYRAVVSKNKMIYRR